MTIGGLTIGVTPLDMAHAYETIAHGGRRVSGTLAEAGAPVGIQEVDSRQPAAARRLARATATASRRKRCCRRRSPRRRPRCSRPCSQYGTGAGGRDRPVRGRQDRHDLQLRRRLVRRLGLQVHGRRVGRLPEQADPDDDRLQRQAGARRHLPGADLAQLHDVRAGDRQGPRRTALGRAAARARRGESTGSGGERRRPVRRRQAHPPRVRPRAAPRKGTRQERATGRGGRRSRAAAPARRAPNTRPRRRHRRPRTKRRAPRRRPHRRRPRRPATPSPTRAARQPRRLARRARAAGAARAAAAQRRAAGRGRETCALPATQKRQGSSTARVMPTRSPVARSPGRATRRRARGSRTGPLRSERAVLASSIAERLRELARARAEVRVAPALARAAGCGARASARCPASGCERADQHRRADALRARRPRSAARGCRRSGRRRRARARRTASRCAASARRTRGRPARCRGRPRSRRSRRLRRRARRCSRSARGATSSTGRA